MKILTLLLCVLLSQVAISQKKLISESNHSTVSYKIPIAGFTLVTGKFTDFKILMDWNEENPNASKISASIKVKSINTGIEDRDNHLQSADFFDAEKYPEIKFESDSIVQVDFSNFKAHGHLNIHGIRKSFTLPLQIVKIENHTFGFKSITSINRLDFDIGTNFKHTSISNFLSEVVEIEIFFWTKKRI